MNAHTEAAVGQKLSVIDLFLLLSKNMVEMPDEESFMESALAHIGTTFQASRVYVFDYKKPFWYNTFEWVKPGVHSVQHLFQGVVLEYIEQLEATMETFFSGELKVIEHIDAIPEDEKDFFADQGIVSLIAIPLFCGGEFMGIFGIDQCEDIPHWAADNVVAAETMGHLLNNAKAHFAAQYVLQQEEKIAKQMLDALPIPFYVVDPLNYELLLYNTAFENFVGKERLCMGKCYTILHDFHAPCEFCGIAQMKSCESTKVWQHHNEIFHTDFTIIASKISWGDIEEAHAVAFMDITDSLLIQREQVLDREAAKMKARFLANMSHELRTPVNGIMGITRMAVKQSTDSHVLEYLEKIQYSSQILLAVINNVLDFLKIEAEKMDIEHCAFATEDVLDALKEKFMPEAEKKGLSLHFFPAHSLPEVLVGDALRFSQILSNLLSNAIKYTESGHICLEINAAQEEDSSLCTVSAQVSDTGLGMSQEHIEQLFNIFFRVDESLTRHQGGAGVGLPLVQGLLKLMGGELKVHSDLGKGSVFTCTIPFHVGTRDALPAAAQDISHAGQDVSIEGLHILLAEDNEINALIATEVLQSLGCTVDVAEDGEQALLCLEKKEYAAILMDLEMPRMNGYEATKKIRTDARFDTLPIIAMSAHSEQDMKKNEDLQGMQDYVTKPFDPQKLAVSIYTHTLGQKK